MPAQIHSYDQIQASDESPEKRQKLKDHKWQHFFIEQRTSPGA